MTEETISGIRIPAFKPVLIHVRCSRSVSSELYVNITLDRLCARFGNQVSFLEVLRELRPEVAFPLLSEAVQKEDAQRLAAHAGLYWAAQMLPDYEAEFPSNRTPREALKLLSEVLHGREASTALAYFHTALFDDLNKASSFFVGRQGCTAIRCIQTALNLAHKDMPAHILKFRLENLIRPVLQHFSDDDIREPLLKMIV